MFSHSCLNACAQAYLMISKNALGYELKILYSRVVIHKNKSLSDLWQALTADSIRLKVFPQVVKLLKIVITAPITTAKPKRCFSTLKRIKTVLRSTMDTDRLSALGMISI